MLRNVSIKKSIKMKYHNIRKCYDRKFLIVNTVVGTTDNLQVTGQRHFLKGVQESLSTIKRNYIL